MNAKPSISILFVCLGNICRSPLAEGVFRHVVRKAGMADRFTTDSAGIGAWHEGNLPDQRSIEVAARHGIDLTDQRARKINAADFSRFSHIFGMDQSNVADLTAIAPAGHTASIHLFLEFATSRVTDISDPYYGGADGFESAYRTIRDASERLVEKLG